MPKWFNKKTFTIMNKFDNVPKARPKNSFANKTGYKQFNIKNNNIDDKRIKNIFVKINDGNKKKIKPIINNNNNISNSNNLDISNKIAKRLDFKDVNEFDLFIKAVDLRKLTTTETRKLRKIFNYLKNVAKRNSKSIAKIAIAGGTIVAMVTFLKNFQDTHSGCFRYSRRKLDDGEIKYKFDGASWCNTDNKNINETTTNIKLLPETEHPLYDQIKWDCDYDKFNDHKTENVGEILNLGCNGLCDWRNFNILAKTTNGEYKPIVSEDLLNGNKYFYNYNYKCETVSILRALSISTTNVLSDLFDVNLSLEIKRIVFLCLFIFLVYKLLQYWNNSRVKKIEK